MSKLFPLRFLVMMGLLGLAGCQSLYQKEYRYIPPQAVADKQCALHCVSAKHACERLCHLKHPACLVNKGNKASPSCSACTCTTSFNTCYRACGGSVIEKNSGFST